MSSPDTTCPHSLNRHLSIYEATPVIRNHPSPLHPLSLMPNPKQHLQLFMILAPFAGWCTAMSHASQPVDPRIEQRVIAPISDAYFRHSEGSAVRLEDGRILLCWSRFYREAGNPLRNDNAPANLVTAHSDDNGRTWSEPVPLPVPKGKLNNIQAALIQVGGRLQLYYSRRDGIDASDKWVIESNDQGESWSRPRRATPGDRPYTGANDRVLQLEDGRLIMRSARVMTELPVSGSPSRMAQLMGAAPRQRGSSEACRLIANRSASKAGGSFWP